MADRISILLCTFLASLLSENSITFTHVNEARKANLHAYKRITIRPAIYERGLFTQTGLLISMCLE